MKVYMLLFLNLWYNLYVDRFIVINNEYVILMYLEFVV